MATVEDVLMTTGPEVIVAGPTTTAAEAARLMDEARVGSVIVKDGDRIAGIFTERDLLSRVVAKGGRPDEVKLSEVMSSPVRTCRLGDEVDACLQTLSGHHIRHLAVVEQGVLVGVLGLRDLLTAKLGQ